MMAELATQAPFASASRRPSFAASTTLILERPCRSQRDGEQGRAEQEDQGRAAERTNRPDGIGKGATPASKPQRKLARAKRERRHRRYGDGGADRHGEGCRH